MTTIERTHSMTALAMASVFAMGFGATPTFTFAAPSIALQEPKTTVDSQEKTRSCGAYLTSPIKFGADNPVVEVLKLQYFLNTHEETQLRLSGTYDADTLAAVHAFQRKYATRVLAPWGATRTTGFVYHTTVKTINELYCYQKTNNTVEFPLTTTQLREIDRFRLAMEETMRTSNEQGEDKPTDPLLNLSELGSVPPRPRDVEKLLVVKPTPEATGTASGPDVLGASQAVDDNSQSVLMRVKNGIASMFSWIRF